MADNNRSSQDNPRKENAADQDFPGYPHYPAGEDITKAANNNGQVDLNVEQMNASGKRAGQEQRGPEAGSPVNSDADERDSDADVTPEDIAILNATTQNRDLDDADLEEDKLDSTDEDGDPLNEPSPGYQAAGSDLDVPGSEADDGNEDMGEEDEENNYYSLGGDNKENLEEDTSQ